MKKLILTITLGTLAMANALAQIPNAGFESWSKPLLADEPTNWATLNSLSFIGYPITVTKTDGRNGGSAIKLEVKEFMNVEKKMDTAVGFTISGTANFLAETSQLGFPVKGRPEKFSGFTKFSSPKKDTGIIVIGFSKWNPIKNEADSIGGTFAVFYNNQPAFTEFASPIFWNSPAIPDTAVIYIFSSVSKKPIPGTALIIDDLSLTGGTNGVVDALSALKNSVYPNPAISELNIDNIDLDAITFTVTDLAGKVVAQKDVDAGQKLQLNTANYMGGMYFYEFKNNQQMVVQKGKFAVSK